MSEKEFDIIIKHKLADGDFVPTNAGWEKLHKAINMATPAGVETVAGNKTFSLGKKMAWAAALLIPICGIAFLLNQPKTVTPISKATQPIENSTVNTTENNNSVTNTNTLEENNTQPYKTPNTSSEKIYTPNNNSSNNYLANTTSANNRTASAVNTNSNFKNSKQQVVNLININNNANENINNGTSIIANNNNENVATTNSNNTQKLVDNILQKEKASNQQSIVIQNNTTDKNKNNTKLFATNTMANYPTVAQKSSKNYGAKNPLGISVTAGYGSSKGSAAIKQAGLLVQQKISTRLYADASIQISSQGGGVINNNVSARRALYSQDVNVLAGNTQDIKSENADVQRQLAVNRIPITQLLCNPSIGYKINERSYLAFGAEVARNIDNSNNIQLNEDLNATAPTVITQKSKLTEWDGGVTGKVGYNLSRRLCAEAKYRQGVVNIVDNLNGNTKRSYGVIGVNYRLR